MSVSVERERDDDGVIDIIDDELELDENRIESAAATTAPLRRLLPLLLPWANRLAARRRPELASILNRGEEEEKEGLALSRLSFGEK